MLNHKKKKQIYSSSIALVNLHSPFTERMHGLHHSYKFECIYEHRISFCEIQTAGSTLNDSKDSASPLHPDKRSTVVPLREDGDVGVECLS